MWNEVAVEKAQKDSKARMSEIESGMEEINLTVEELQQKQSSYARVNNIRDLEKKIDDLENRSRRNNIVVWGIPEDREGDT